MNENNNGLFPLCSLDFGKSAVIVSIPRGSVLSRKMTAFGLIPGIKITPLFSSPFRDPKAYEFSDTIVALRNDDASSVIVTTDFERGDHSEI